MSDDNTRAFDEWMSGMLTTTPRSAWDAGKAMAERAPCPHCEESHRKCDDLLKKYLARRREMDQAQDDLEARLRDQFAMAAVWAPLGSAKDIAELSYAIADGKA